MAASGYTPINSTGTSTASATPTFCGNLADGELAINTADGRNVLQGQPGCEIQTLQQRQRTGTVTSVVDQEYCFASFTTTTTPASRLQALQAAFRTFSSASTWATSAALAANACNRWWYRRSPGNDDYRYWGTHCVGGECWFFGRVHHKKQSAQLRLHGC
jgi:hypothetical protein